MSIPKELKYTKTHEWAKDDNGKLRVGITDYAQNEISDVVFVEVPKVGKQTEQGKPVAVVESVKAAFDIYAPVSGKITQVNRELDNSPSLVNDDCYGKGWLFEMEPSDASQSAGLMDAASYENHLKQETT